MPTTLPEFFRYLINLFITFLLIPITMAIVIQEALRNEIIINNLVSFKLNLVLILCSSFVTVFVTTLYFMSKPRPIYLVDFSCFKPPFTCRVPFSTFMEHTRLLNNKSSEFQMRILQRSGLGEETCLPPAFNYIPPSSSMQFAREEAQTVIFSAIDSLFLKTGNKAKDIDILVVNCSRFSPTPSLSAMVVNHYKMRSNIRSFDLAGMGCSAGLLSVDLARDLLEVHPNSNALVVSTEILSNYWYAGNQRSMLLANSIFRMGGAAVLLSNRRCERQRAKYRLLHLFRTHKGADDKAYRSVFEEEDEHGNVGMSLQKDLKVVAC